jgi:membrane-associated phospholipid phosphatase
VRKYSTLKKLVRLFKGLSLAISIVFHPLLLPTYIFILIGYFSPLAISPLNTLEGRRFLIGLIFLSTFFMPFLLLTLYIMIQNSNWSVKNFFMENSRDRVFPLLLIGSFYSILIYFIRITPQLNEVIFTVMTSLMVTTLIIALISNFWKISAHAVGISGMIGILAIINNKIPDASLFYPLMALILLAGFLLSARLYLNAHNPLQILGGTVLGLTISGFSYFFL